MTTQLSTGEVAKEASRKIIDLARAVKLTDPELLFGIIDLDDTMRRVKSHRASMYRNRGYLVESKTETMTGLLENTEKERKYISAILYHAYMIGHIYDGAMQYLDVDEVREGNDDDET